MRPNSTKLQSAPKSASEPRKRLFVMAIDMYDEHAAEQREKCHREYVAHQDFEALQAKALKRGFRKATMQEIHASARSAPFALELFGWRGGLWVRL